MTDFDSDDYFEDLAAAMASLPDRRDFAFSVEIGRVAWIDDDTVEWLDDDSPDRLGRVTFPEPLPAPTQLEIVDRDLIGLCRPTAAGLEVMALDLDSASGTGTARTVADLATPQTCLIPRIPGADWQLLAVVGFDDTTTVFRISWRDGSMTEAGKLPAPMGGGVWLDDVGEKLAVNLAGESGRSSVYVVEFAAKTFARLFEASPESEDRIVLSDPGTGRVVVTTDAYGYPAVGIAEPRAASGIRFIPALEDGDEGGEPCALLPDGRSLVLRHENGVESHLRLADGQGLEVAGPIPLPTGEVGTPVVVDDYRLRFPFSTPDEPWRPASFDLRTGAFAFDPLPLASHSEELVTARVASFPSGAGPMPALVFPPRPPTGRSRGQAWRWWLSTEGPSPATAPEWCRSSNSLPAWGCPRWRSTTRAAPGPAMSTRARCSARPAPSTSRRSPPSSTGSWPKARGSFSMERATEPSWPSQRPLYAPVPV